MTLIQDYLEELGLEYIVVELNPSDFLRLGLDVIEESRWVDSNKKGWSQLVDPARPQMNLKRHVHVARTKHINTKAKQVSWNDDGSRHDKKTFNPNLSGIKTAKKIAQNALGLDPNVVLEELSKARQFILLTESFSDVTSSSPFKPIYLRVKAEQG